MQRNAFVKRGAKLTYDEKLLPDILAAVREARGSIGQIADLIEKPRQTFRDWLHAGEEDRNNGISSPLAQLACSLKKEQAKVVKELADHALFNHKKAKFIMWWLSCCFREDFGRESEEMRELRRLFEQLILAKGLSHE